MWYTPRLPAAPKGAGLQLGCRQPGYTNPSRVVIEGGYRLAVRPDDRRFTLERVVADTPIPLWPWQRFDIEWLDGRPWWWFDRIKGGSQINHLQLQCSGDRISASING